MARLATTARFPGVAAGAGHYESFYLKACHPSEPQAVWIRYTVHKPPWVRERPVGCELVLPGASLTVQAAVGAEPEAFVGWVYADPDGCEHHAVNCSVADMELVVSSPARGARSLALQGGAAYELGMREHDHGMAVQPFPDG